MKRNILIVVGTIIVTLFVTRIIPPREAVQKLTKSEVVGSFETINCQNCNVLRITESAWSGIMKTGPDRVWEILAKTGTKTSTSDWSLEIISVSPKSLKVKFNGKIYKDLELVKNLVQLDKWSKNEEFTDGRVGGGKIWDFIYFQKTN